MSALRIYVMGTAHKYTIHNPNLNHKSEMGSPDWNMSMVNIHLQRFLWIYCPGHAEVKGNDQANRLVGKATITSGLFCGRP